MSNENLAAEAVASKVLALAAGLSNPDVTVNSTCRLCDLGFDDLDAVELVMAVEDELGVDINVDEYDDNPDGFLNLPLQALIDKALAAMKQRNQDQDAASSVAALCGAAGVDMGGVDLGGKPEKAVGHRVYRGKGSLVAEQPVEAVLAIFPSHERRVIEEYCELVGRRNRLIDFLGSMKFQGLPAEDQDLLKRQLDVMNDYAKILVKRCDRFEVPAGLVCPGLVPVDNATDGGPNPHYDREALAKKMVDRFLGWKLPQNFAPDGGVSFVPPFHWPTGTNLLHAGQALEMFRYCLGLADAEEVQP